MKFINTARRYGSKIALVGTSAVVAVQAHAAAGELATAATTEMTNAKTDVSSVIMIMIGVAAVMAVGGLILSAIKKR